MTDRYIDLETEMNNPDLDLITDYLANELKPEDVAAVRRRLDDDPAFRDYCAPIIAAWNARPPIPPMSDAELRASWDRLRQRAGWLPAPPKPRRPWLRVLSIVTVIVGALVTLAFVTDVAAFFFEPIGEAFEKRFEFTGLADSGHVMRLADGATVRLGPGARLWVQDHSETNVRRVKLEGSAFFEVRPPAAGPSALFVVETRGAHIRTSNADFQVDARGDTTELAAGKPGATAFDREPATVGQVVYLAAWGTPGRSLAALIGDRLLAVRGKGAIPLVRAQITTYPPPANPTPSATSDAPRVRRTDAPSRQPDSAQPVMRVVRTIDPAAFGAQAGVSQLAEGMFSLADPGARITPPSEVSPPEPMKVVQLEGSATFVVAPDGLPLDTKGRNLFVLTRGGTIVTSGAAMRVATRGDTTECEVFALAPGADSLRPRPMQIVIIGPSDAKDADLGTLMLVPGMSARIVRGGKPAKLPGSP